MKFLDGISEPKNKQFLQRMKDWENATLDYNRTASAPLQEEVLVAVLISRSRRKFIGVRWVDVNRGTKEVPKVTSKLVGQEFAHGQRREDLYAPTPPSAAARYLLSTCAFTTTALPQGTVLCSLDAKIKTRTTQLAVHNDVRREVDERVVSSTSGIATHRQPGYL